jgi:prepilin-type N-terminal cleavage/methylation domain-containing protein
MLTRISKTNEGFTLVEIMIVVAIIGILVAIGVPGFINSRRQSQAKACQENQMKVSGAVMRYALANSSAAVPEWGQLIGTTLYLARTPICPTTGTAIPLPPSIQAVTHCPTDENGHEVVEGQSGN